MRMYQEIGLKPEARTFLDENARMVPGARCPNCSHILSMVMDDEIYEHQDSFYDDGPSLRKINLKDGRVALEVVQAEPWSSGPCAFFCLEIDGKRYFEWTDEEIDERI
jgi:hypothetical protein